ncbi:tyrosine-type recombinase/integrase [Sanguibacteroides justesenii]|uniref:tyrosine-type recombinase/integrase n=1 Tax=Sanguibacteroides justesenii TaxID=1547597 RepID=UPI00293711BF|nr:tyrosine-type recombinase/integrase [Sanguibacteroides justesenii]
MARHSWATIAHRKGIPLHIISEGMGHHSERTTVIYLDSLDNRLLDKANEEVTSL